MWVEIVFELFSTLMDFGLEALKHEISDMKYLPVKASQQELVHVKSTAKPPKQHSRVRAIAMNV